MGEWSMERILGTYQELENLRKAVVDVARRYQGVTTKAEDKNEYGRVYYPPASNAEVYYNAKSEKFTVTWNAFRDQWDDIEVPARLLIENGWEERIRAKMEKAAELKQEYDNKQKERDQQRHEAWEKETYERLRGKFEE